MMPKKRQALVEYEDMNGSCNAVTYAAENQVYIAGHPAFINYSTSQKISRPGDSDDTRSVNNVLLLTIINPIYPITTVTWLKNLTLRSVTVVHNYVAVCWPEYITLYKLGQSSSLGHQTLNPVWQCWIWPLTETCFMKDEGIRLLNAIKSLCY